MKTGIFNKRQLRELQDATEDLKAAWVDADSSVWYFHQNSDKGHEWGHSARRRIWLALNTIEKLFPAPESETREKYKRYNRGR